MDEPLKHRLNRFLRLIVGLGLISQGTVAPLGTPAYADNPDAVVLGFIPVSSTPPDSIVDLMASANPSVIGQVSLTWTAPQGNAGGTPLKNQPVLAYSVRYATFSITSLNGDSAAWWNAAASSNLMLSPPAYTPKAPGQLESFALAGLPAGQTLYFAVKSISLGGVISPIDTNAATAGLQAYAFTGQTQSGAAKPQAPPGILGSLNGQNQLTISWHPVTRDVNLAPTTINHYRVERYNVLGGTATYSAIIPGNVTQFTQATNGGLYYYRIFADDNSGQESDASYYVDSSDQPNIYILSPDDPTTRLQLTAEMAKQLRAENNTFNDDIDIRLTRRRQDEFDITLRSYEFMAYRLSTGQTVPDFNFTQTNASVHMGYSGVLDSSNLTLQQSQTLGSPSTPTYTGPIAQIITIYWFNGSSYVRISDPVLTSDQALAVNVRALGIYQIRAVRIGNSFQLVSGSPYPRIITPNDPSQNNRVFFFFDNPTDETVSGTIYDIRGAKVCDLRVDGNSPTSNSLVWTGRNSVGSVVPSGVYLYKISAGKDVVTGTVVVAR